MAAAYPGQYNTFVPSFDASGQLVIAFSRNPKDFALNSYVTIVPVKKSSGFYLNITPEVAARLLSTDLKEFVWPDANDAPTGEWSREGFEFKQFETQRYAFPFRIGYKAEQQADWKILASHSAMHAQLAMTARTLQVLTLLVNTASWPTGHTDTATNLGGGVLSGGSPTDTRVKKALNAAALKIQKDTLGVVKPKDLIVVMSPELADPIARSQEVHTYLKESPAALAQVRGDVPSQNGQWGLPDSLYGYKIIIEDAVKGANRKGATFSPGYALGSGNLIMLSRPGALVAAEGSRNFGTVTLFMQEEMTVEQKDDPDNRRIAARVVEDYDVRLTAGASGYLITSCL